LFLHPLTHPHPRLLATPLSYFAILASVIPFIHLGPLSIPTYGLMVAIAMVAAYYLLRADLARRGIADLHSPLPEMFIAVPCLAGIIGAKLYHALQSPRELLADPLGLIFSHYGFAWFGGLIAGFAAFVWLARHHKIPILEMLDAGSPAAALGYGIGRIGCLLSGDGDYGTPTALPWGMSFPHGLVPTDQRVHPTPIYEFIVACLIAWILWRLGARELAARRLGPASSADPHSRASSNRTAGPAHYGAAFAAYLVLTGIARFLVEFIRINPRSFFGLTNAQAASLASILGGAVLWFYAQHHAASPAESIGFGVAKNAPPAAPARHVKSRSR
jgi:phosphatidylglycerol---prolipoprotein diacylglyceryl transferase